MRLFPNRPNHRYRGRVHETIDASIQAGGGRLNWYIEILKEEIAGRSADDRRTALRCE